MPFLAIILDFDIILDSFWLKIIKIRVLGQKSLSTKKKGPCQDAGHSRPEWGSTPDAPFFKIRELANSKLFFIKINEDSMNFIYVGLFSLRIGGIGRKAFSIYVRSKQSKTADSSTH